MASTEQSIQYRSMSNKIVQRSTGLARTTFLRQLPAKPLEHVVKREYNDGELNNLVCHYVYINTEWW